MIHGHATPEATGSLASCFPHVIYRRLGRTGLSVSGAGFGGYRVHTGAAAHAPALESALTAGINFIDTSANYTDGGSERLVGEVLASLVAAGRIERQQVVVITKGGYLQGENYDLSQKRKAAGTPFPELVDVADGLEHCIHPDFLKDQIARSRKRLGLDTIDGYLLHNPEYYLTGAHQRGDDLETARREYRRRIEAAFVYLETEVASGHIRFYGISSNTFPSADTAADFTSLAMVDQVAEAMGPDHHFRMIQFPFNLFERGAVLEKNQPDGKTILALAHEKQIGVVINRPLNAFSGRRLIRLADVEVRSRMDYADIIHRIKALAQSETRLWRRILPAMTQIPGGLKVRIKQQFCVAETLKHHWRSFGSLERWHQTRDAVFMPRIQGVTDFLSIHAETDPDLADWLGAYEETRQRAFSAVASIYADAAVARERSILRALSRVDPAWDLPGTLSQRAIRALLSTAGVTSVLVGMRRKAYVKDVLAAIADGVTADDRCAAWARLEQALDDPADPG